MSLLQIFPGIAVFRLGKIGRKAAIHIQHAAGGVREPFCICQPFRPGFALLESIPIRFSFTVEGTQVQNLFSMTPHLFRVSKAGADRLRETQSLTDTASCVLNVFRRT